MNPNQNVRTQNQQNGSYVAPEKEPLKMDVDPIPFDGLIKSKLVTTSKLGTLVWNLLKPVFPEYEGCVILPNQYGQLETTLYFKDKGKLANQEGVKAMVPVGARTAADNAAFDRIASLNQRLSSRKFELSKDAKDLLSEFYWIRPGQKIAWNNFVTEVTQQEYNSYSVFLKVAGVDIGKMLRKIYGNKVNGSYTDYQISLIKPIGQDISGSIPNYLISIQQLDTKEVENLAKEVGFIPVQGSIPLLRG